MIRPILDPWTRIAALETDRDQLASRLAAVERELAAVADRLTRHLDAHTIAPATDRR